MPIAAIAGIAAAGSIASGVIGANAAGNAASTQAAAANNAATLEHQSATDALNFNKLQYGNSLSLLAPYYNTGVSANSRLAYLMGLNPAQGLPAGVVNPNAPQGTGSAVQGGLGSGFNRMAFSPQGKGNPLANDPSFGPLGVGQTGAGGPRFSPIQDGIEGNGFSGPQFGGGPSLPGPNGGLANEAGNPTGLINGTQSGLTIPSDVVNATTNQGGTGQVPQAGDPNAPGGFGSLAQGWNQTFQSPTDVTEQNDPGYQFRLQQGQQALQNSAAARGGLLSGGTAKALTDYNQNAASGEYGNVYNRALQNYNTNYNTFTNDQTNLFNRLSTLSGQGQVSANNLSSAGLATAGNAANIGLTSAGQIGQQLNNAGAATASGYVGGANAITGAIGGVTNSLSTLALLRQLQGGGNSNPNAGMGVY